MARFVARIETALPVPAAFDYMAHLVHFEEWDPGVKGVTQVVGDRPGPGAAYDVTVGGVGGDMTLRYVIVEFEPQRRVVARAETARIASLDIIGVAPAPGGALVTYEANLSFRGVLRFANPLMGPVISRIVRRAERGLRQRFHELAA